MIDTHLDPGRAQGGLDGLLGTRFEEVSGERVVLTLTVGAQHHQPYGLVHGGVYAALAETAASYGAALALGDGGGGAVGLSNHTDFLHAVREGGLRAEATPLSQGRTFQVWTVAITDDRDRLVAQSKVRLYNLRADGEGPSPAER